MYDTLIRVRDNVNWRPHCTAYIVRRTLYGVPIVRRTLYGVHCTASTLYGVHCTAYIVRRTLYGVHCTAYIVRRTIVCPAIYRLIQMPYMDIQVYVITL